MGQVTAGRRDAAADASTQAEALIALGRYEHALAVVARGLILAPSDARLHCQRAAALLRMGRLRAASQAAGDAISADPDDPLGYDLKSAALAALARIRVRLWRRQFGLQAQAAARRAVALAPEEARFHCRAADAELLAGDWPAASVAAAQAIALAPDRAASYVAVSRVALAARDFATARTAATHGLALDPQNYEAMSDLGSALVGLARWKQAAETLAAAARLDPRARPARDGLVRLGLLIVGTALSMMSLALVFALQPVMDLPLGVLILGVVDVAAATAVVRSERLQRGCREVGLRTGLRLARTRLGGPVLAVSLVVGAGTALALAVAALAGAAVALPALAWSVGPAAAGAAASGLSRVIVEHWRGPELGPRLVVAPPRTLAGVRGSLVAGAAVAGWVAAAGLARLQAPGRAVWATAAALIAASFTLVGARRVYAVAGRWRGRDRVAFR